MMSSLRNMKMRVSLYLGTSINCLVGRNTLVYKRSLIFICLIPMSTYLGCGSDKESSQPQANLSAPKPKDPLSSQVLKNKNSSQKSSPKNDLGSSNAKQFRNGSKDAASRSATNSLNGVSSSPDLSRDPSTDLSIEALQQSVIDDLEVGDLDAAWKSIRIVIREDPNNFDSLYLRARVLAERNRFAEAVKILDDLSGRDPGIRLPVLGQTAEWLTFDGRWEAAEKRYRELVKEIPEAGLAHRRLAQLLVRQGKRSEACHLFELLCQSGNVEEVELRHLLRSSRPFQGMESDGESEPIGSFGRAKFLYGENLIDEALVEIEGCDPDAEQAFALKGRLLALSAQKKELAEWDSQSIANNESLSDYWFAKGVHAQNEKNHKKAIQFLCRGILLDPTDSEAYQILSESLKDNQQIQISEIAKKRQEKILATHKTGQAFTDSETRDPQSVASLCRILDELHRPIESLAWQAVAMVYNQEEMGLSNEQLALQLQNINQKRIRLIRNNEAEATNEFILCGLNLNQVISPASTEEKNGFEVE